MSTQLPPAGQGRSAYGSGGRPALTAGTWLAVVAGAILVAAPMASATEAECPDSDRPVAEEPGGPCAVLAARAVWLNAGSSDMEERLQLYATPSTAEDDWLGPDKLMHLGVSAMLTLSTQYFLVHRMGLTNERAWPVAAGTALAFGLFKELADSQRQRDPLFSWRDMAANLTGVSLALAIILL